MAEIVVVTGASAGVGRAVAVAFVRRGCKVGLLARGAEGLKDAVAEIERAGGQAFAVPTDVADAEAVERAAASIEEHFGPIDIWVNAAMATIFGPVHAITPDEFRRSTEVTYLGCVYGTLAALKRMRSRNKGTIVQVGSALAYRAIPLQAPYCAGKFAIRGFTDSLRTELQHEKSPIHLTMVQLPAVNTPQFDWARNKMSHRPQPVGPIYQPELIAKAIVYAAYHRRREIDVCFSSFKAIWANKIVPGLLDRYLAKAGYSGQLTAEPSDPGRPDNLFQPVDGTAEGVHGAHGRFDDRSRSRSLSLWLNLNREWLAVGALGVAALVAARRARLVGPRS